jgi:hypothetical protein
MVLLGVGKGFLRLITTQDNGIVVDGKPFYISTDTQKKMHELAKEMKPHGSFTKGFCSIAECASYALSGALEHVMPTVVTSSPKASPMQDSRPMSMPGYACSADQANNIVTSKGDLGSHFPAGD